MGKKKDAKSDKSGRGSEQAGLVPIDPAVVYFTHARIRPQFSCGRRIEDTIEDVATGKITVEDLPPITLIASMTPCGLGPPYFSLNNRRLYTLKNLRERGIITTVNVRVKPPLDSKRERERYTVDKMSLTARLMGVKAPGETDAPSDLPDSDTSPTPTPAEAPAGAPAFPIPHSWKRDCFDSTVYAVDINSLAPKKWVRDPVVSYAFDLFAHTLAAEGAADRVRFIPPAVAMLLSLGGDASIAEGMGLHGFEKVVVAVNDSQQECPVSGSHWSLLVWDAKAGQWFTADSCNNANAAVAKRLADSLHRHVVGDAAAAEATALQRFDQEEAQRNASDCGIYTVLHAAKIVGLAGSIPSEPPAIRAFLKESIWNHSA
eukprot:TRINITY_DN19307_c0_g1_i1.p1 TRINITY_DN19307_c0_g1~~TRINITY_DN19307_c0_g1_i1.p1  ORF type:complete len:374 (+),score=115.73 TRINITY_DN19307_c0_g1_i1:105-1226(+)